LPGYPITTSDELIPTDRPGCAAIDGLLLATSNQQAAAPSSAVAKKLEY